MVIKADQTPREMWQEAKDNAPEAAVLLLKLGAKHYCYGEDARVLRYAMGQWEEEKHPRVESGTAEGGQFGSGEGGAAEAEKQAVNRQSATVTNGKLLLESGKPLPKHLQDLRIRRNWKDITVSTNSNDIVLVEARDEKNRKQVILSARGTTEKQRVTRVNAAMKWSRVAELRGKFTAVQQENESAMKGGDVNKREDAAALSLIMSVGLRPGSTRDTKAEKQAFGATTLLGRHVIVGDGVRLRFVGKKGVDIDIPVNDPVVAEMLRSRREKAGANGRLFNTSDVRVLAHAKTLDGGSFRTKDFRTNKGTSLAAALVSQGSIPASGEEYKASVSAVAKAVSEALGNTPAVALQSYIDPTVFLKWRPAA